MEIFTKNQTVIYDRRLARVIGPSALIDGCLVIEFVGTRARTIVLPSTLCLDTFGQTVREMLAGKRLRGK